MKTKEIFLSNESIADEFIKSHEYPYEVLPNIKSYILDLGSKLGSEFKKNGDDIWVHEKAVINKNAEIKGPCIIDEGAEIRFGSFIRGSVIIGKNTVIGNSCEIKNVIIYDNVQIPHFNYVGDSIIGSHAHFGAGVIVSNLKSDKKNIVIKYNGAIIETGMRKIGAFVGDSVEVGCNSVINPGTIIMANSNIYPLTNVRGVIPSGVIVKSMDNIVEKEVR